MIELPEIGSKTMSRPGYLTSDKRHLISNPLYQTYWEDFYSQFYESFKLFNPIENFSDKINPYFGYFGFRWHPINFQPRYYHIGIDISDKINCPIQNVYDGLLEYSGFADINGNYVIIKHPDIRTSDGFIFQSLYMHCNDINVKFELLQKLLREFVSKTLTSANKVIEAKHLIATLGDTGNKLGVVPHLHLQFEFVRGDEHIAIDPLKLFNKASHDNLTGTLHSENEFKDFFRTHSNELVPWRKFWHNKI